MARIGFAKLQHIYDLHAGDFGLVGKKNPEQLRQLDDALRLHLVNEGTRVIEGRYRGCEANLYFNAETQNVVVTDKQDDIIAGFKTSSAQAAYILTKGRLS